MQLSGGNMIYSFDDLQIKFQGYTDIKGKIRREVQAGRLIPVARGLYETDQTISGKYLAGRIYGPSYLSFDFALYVYSLIPEAVYNTYTSATFDKRKTKKYQNQFGVFTYRDIPTEVYPLGVLIIEENGYSYQIATPEKALCDKLYTISPVSNLTELKELLFDDLRIDEDEFEKLDHNTLETLAPLYHSTNLNLLAKLIRRNR
jgi:hypothetical protein